MLNLTKLSDYAPERKRAPSKDDTVTEAAAIVAVMRPDLNGEEIAAYLRDNGTAAARGPYCNVIANAVRPFWRVLMSPGAEIVVGGKRYALREIPVVPSVLKKA